mmetsp:Transcript_20853/g.65173  ORF Transcript_20853/g.65173 Transcript_20853/m.65173 type:complete len:218 (-) Transcript_20853:1147-1800(-)
MRLSRKKQVDVSATVLALSCHLSSNLASFCWRSSSVRLSKQRPSRASHSFPKWYLSAASEPAATASARVSASMLTIRGEGSSPARSSIARPYSPHSLLSSVSSRASLANLPLNSSVCTRCAYILSWFATLSAWRGRAVLRIPSTCSRSCWVASKKAPESSSSDAWSSEPQSRTSCEALGTTWRWWLKSRRMCSRASSPGASKKLSSCDATSMPLASS